MVEKLEIEGLRSYYKEHLETAGYADWTVKHYLYWFDRFGIESFFEGNGQAAINNFLKEKDNVVKRGFLRSFLKFIGELKNYEMPDRERTANKKRLLKDLSAEEVKKISDYLYKTDFRKGFLFDLVYEGALRRGEIGSIKTNSFNWDKWLQDVKEMMELRVIGKGDKERIVLIGSKTILKFLECMDNQGKDPTRLIEYLKSHNERFFAWGAKSFYKFLSVASLKAIDKHVNPHLLRHSRATNLLDKGVEIKDIQNYLGHSNLATTERYLHRSERQSLQNIKQNLTAT